MPAIRIKNATRVTMNNVRIRGFDVGIHATDSEFTANDMHFDGVKQPYKVQGGQARISNSDAQRIPPQSSAPSFVSGSVGKRGLKAPPVPAQCGKCGSIFASRQFTVFNATIHSHGNTETCPVCMSEGAAVATGIFEIAMDAIKLLAGTESTLAQMAFLSSLLDEVTSGTLPVQDAILQADSIKLGLGTHIKSLAQSGFVALAFLGVIAGLYADAPPLTRDISVWAADVISNYIIASDYIPDAQSQPYGIR